MYFFVYGTVNISDVTQKLNCINSHLVTYNKKDLPRRFHYITNDRIDDILLILADTWMANGLVFVNINNICSCQHVEGK